MPGKEAFAFIYFQSAQPFPAGATLKVRVSYQDLSTPDTCKADLATVRVNNTGTDIEIDLNKANAEKLRKAFAPFIEKAVDASPRSARGRSSRDERSGGSAPTAFSNLIDDEKTRYRKWANAPTARRISDERVKSWEEAGKP
jgi:hypothetical protein